MKGLFYLIVLALFLTSCGGAQQSPSSQVESVELLEDEEEEVASTEIQDENKKALKKQKERVFVVQHPNFYRPAEVNELIGDPKKAREELGWECEVNFEELVKMMVKADLEENNLEETEIPESSNFY